jgi:hypothetical protein
MKVSEWKREVLSSFPNERFVERVQLRIGPMMNQNSIPTPNEAAIVSFFVEISSWKNQR